ncbi:acetyltransferase [Pseudobutyrivibrio xylanivorans]|uniref:Transferase hexapeptide (Six repeat-containing protein) n=1 Tax=Pseudobutyrivibrio xylanivorans DSM 14809 TaxID=1123012 RepID=A0A1M6JEK1_PSEXY|nr:acetyltransferase [Pseudobutyrivibrio xylanivorans]SHJ45163.1 transferase hexapeptide (six repeat-containing protein) [Pseudobutyrivibrio xylanivorans DSM 14809]
MKKIVIIGASGHGKVIADIALRCGYDEVAFLDDNPTIKTVGEYEVLGASDLARELASEGYDFVVGIGNAGIRERIQNRLLDVGCNVVTLVHPSATVAYDVTVGRGTVVMAGAVIESGTVIGHGCIINTSASVGSDNEIDDYTHISVGSTLGNKVCVESKSWVGIGAKVSDEVKICSGAVIGAGTNVTEDIIEDGIYVGAPAKRIK